MVSVLMVTLRRDSSLARALKSLRRQTWRDWEAVIVDNGASAETRVLVESYQDSRLHYVAVPENLGECAGRNRALQLATSRFVCYLDDDDLLPRHSLGDRVAFLEANPDCAMIYAEYARFQQIDGAWRRLRERRATEPYLRKQFYDGVLRRVQHDRELTFYFLKHFNFIRGGTPLMRREALDEVGRFDEELELYGDYDLWLRLASRYSIRFLNRVAYIYCLHAGSMSLSMDGTAAARMSARRICRKHGIENNLHFNRYQGATAAEWRQTTGVV
jgi:glycosyltransferase involved in cell wall biosynthesis